MKANSIKTIDILTKTWFDKINGNTYFAQSIVINYGMKNEKEIKNHFQYGYSSYDYFAACKISEELGINKDDLTNNKKIIWRSYVHRNCKKRELTNI